MPLTHIGIVHQDSSFLIVDKPTLLLSVPGRAEDNKDCLITRLQENGYPEARIVHRLDWETSGLLVIARNPDAHRELSRQFHDRETEKAYIALCWGQPEGDAGHIDLPLRYDPPNKPRHIVDHELGTGIDDEVGCEQVECHPDVAIAINGYRFELRLNLQRRTKLAGLVDRAPGDEQFEVFVRT